MLGLEYFGFRELWSPVFMMVIIAIAIVYLMTVGPWRHRFARSEPVSSGRKAYFLIGLFFYYIAQGGPLDLLGHLMFSAHMLSMSLAYIVAPPLILLGLPAWLLRPLISKTMVKQAITAITHPILAVLMFNMLFSFYHLPVVHDYIMTHYFVHIVYYLLLLFAAFVMWWVVICPVPELDRVTEVRKMGYIFANGVLLTPACALIIFAGSPLYGTFSDPAVWAQAMGYCVPANSTILLSQFTGPDFFATMPPLDDQQFGGVLMKLIQEVVYGAVLALTFFQWYRRENPKDAIDPLQVVYANPNNGRQ